MTKTRTKMACKMAQRPASTLPKAPTPIDAATRQVIERHHEFEIDFYRRAAERFA